MYIIQQSAKHSNVYGTQPEHAIVIKPFNKLIYKKIYDMVIKVCYIKVF
jgi:hypothetical protein